MEPLDVPEINQLPDLSGMGEDPAAFAGMVLTSLLQYGGAMLHADDSLAPASHPVSWMICPEGGEQEIEIACSPTVDSFHSVLAHLETLYLTNGSEALRALRQRDRVHWCRFSISQQCHSSRWIKIQVESPVECADK